MKLILLVFASIGAVVTPHCVPQANDSKIMIRLLDSHNGKPVPQVIIHISKDKDLSHQIDLKTDNDGIAFLDASQIPNEFRIWAQEAGSGGWGLIHCDFDKHKPKGTPYSTAVVVREGIASPNLCSHRKAVPKPGEFVLFVRQQTLWEKFKS
jgi:hypothetical protein